MKSVNNQVATQKAQQTVPQNTTKTENNEVRPQIKNSMADPEFVRASLEASEKTAKVIGDFLSTVKNNNAKNPVKTGTVIDENGYKITTMKLSEGGYKVIVRDTSTTPAKKLSENNLRKDGSIEQTTTFGTSGKIVTKYNKKGETTSTESYVKLNGEYVKKTSVKYEGGEAKTIERLNPQTGEKIREGTVTKDKAGNTSFTLTDIKTGELTNEWTVNSKGEKIRQATYSNYAKDGDKTTRNAKITENGETVYYAQTLDRDGNLDSEVVTKGKNKGYNNVYCYNYSDDGKIESMDVIKYDAEGNYLCNEEHNLETGGKIVRTYDERGREKIKEFDANGRLVKEIPYVNEEISYTYDENGNLQTELHTRFQGRDEARKPSHYELYEYNQQDPYSKENTAVKYKSYSADSDPKSAKSYYVAYASNGEEEFLEYSQYAVYSERMTALNNAEKNGIKLTDKQKATLQDGFLYDDILNNRETLELANKVLYGKKRNDPALDSKLKTFEDEFGISIFTDNNVVSEEYYNANKKKLEGTKVFVVTDNLLNGIKKGLKNMSVDDRERLPKEIVFTRFVGANGRFLPNSPGNEDKIFINSYYLQDKKGNAKAIRDTLYHETAHMNDYYYGNNDHLSERKDIEVQETGKFGTKETGKIKASVAENYVGSYALTDNAEFVAEVTTWIMYDVIVYDDKNDRYTINPNKLGPQKGFTSAKGKGQGYDINGHIAKWDGSKEDIQNLNTLMNIYYYLMTDENNVTYQLAKPKTLSEVQK